MLYPPTGWPNCSTAHLVEHLVQQADQRRLYAEAARALTRACLEYMLSTPRWMIGSARVPLLQHPMGWRVNDRLFHVLPRVDAASLPTLKDLSRHRCQVELIVPPDGESSVKGHVASLLRDFNVDVHSVDSFVCTRVLLARLDLQQSSEEGLVELLRRYQRLVHTIPALHVDLPCDAAATCAGLTRERGPSAAAPTCEHDSPARTSGRGALSGHIPAVHWDDAWHCGVSEAMILDILDSALAALGDASAMRRLGPVTESDAIDQLLRLRDEIEPETPNATKAKILREIEAFVRRYDMICDDLWDRDEPIHQVYDRCVAIIGRPPAKFSEIHEYIQDVLQQLELD